jgi:hypothetical protein
MCRLSKNSCFILFVSIFLQVFHISLIIWR